jgi:Zn finger protein HypA/HybF involved in hydrogenase expression
MSRKHKKNRESKSTCFNIDWQNAELYPVFSEWVEKVEGEKQYCKCRWCNQQFFLSGMDRRCTSCKITKTLKALGPEKNSSFGFNLPI